MTTSKKVAREAGKQLQSKSSSKLERSVAASDLAQAKKKKPNPKNRIRAKERTREKVTTV